MTDQLTGRVSAHPFFAGLTAEQLAALAGHGVPVRFAPDERIFAEGGVADRFWLIESGSVALDMRVPGRGDQTLETLIGGTVLGWSWLHAPYRWQFGAVAREPTTAIAFDAPAVRRRCEADAAFGYAILRSFTPVITDRLQATRLRVLDLYASPAQAGQARAGRTEAAKP
jgi:CRP/FNR family transcriptional regulator, cyclic AMP receptor protein